MLGNINDAFVLFCTYIFMYAMKHDANIEGGHVIDMNTGNNNSLKNTTIKYYTHTEEKILTVINCAI